MKKNVALQLKDHGSISRLIRFRQLNDFDHVHIDYGTTVNTQVDFRFPLLFSNHLFKEEGYQQEKKLYPALATFFYQTMSHEPFDIVRIGAAPFPFASKLAAYLKEVKTLLQAEGLTDILNRFKCRFIVANAFVSGNWEEAHRYFESFNSPQRDPELSWYENACLFKKFSALSCTSFTKAQAEYWMSCMMSLEPKYCKPAMQLGFLNIYKEKMSDFPDIHVFETKFTHMLSPLEIEGTFSQVTNRVVKTSLHNDIMRSVDDLSFKVTLGDNGKKRFAISFDEADLLGKTDSFYFDISNYGDRSSLVAFFAQYQLSPLCLKLENQPDLSPEQNELFRHNFFSGLKDRGWINSTEALVFPLEERVLKSFFVETLRPFFPGLPSAYGDCLLPQIEAGKRLYDQKLKLFSGFVQHDAIAIFIKILYREARGVADESLHRSMIKSLKSCLQLRLRSIDISCMDEEHQDKAWDALSQKVLEHLNKGEGILIPSGAPIDDNTGYSGHAIYVAIRHVTDTNLVKAIIINGGEACTEYHSECVMQAGEMPYYYYKQSEALSLDVHQAALKSFIRTALSFPYTRSDWASFYENPDISFKDHPQAFPLQLMGSCAIHNLKYAVKALFGFSEIEMGNMMRSGMIGMDAISRARGEVEDLGGHLLNEQYVSVRPVHRKLSIARKSYTNFDNAMQNNVFKAQIQLLKETYKKEKVDYLAKQLFSSPDKDFDNLDRFVRELTYDLQTKAGRNQPLTLQELYMTSYGWNRPRVETPSQQLKLYRTMNKTDWDKLNTGDYSVLAGGHIGDFKQALRYLMGNSSQEKVMIEFTLKPGAENQLFSKSLALPIKEKRSDMLKKIAEGIGGDSFPICNYAEGTSNMAIGLKSESAGEAGFSIGIGGGPAPSKFQELVELAQIIRRPPK